MSVAKRQKDDEQINAKKRGSVNNKGRLQAFKEGNRTVGADWGACNPDKLQTIVAAITNLGGAITIGLSRDQGAHSMTLMLDGDRQTLWFNGNADLDQELDNVMGTLEAMT